MRLRRPRRLGREAKQINRSENTVKWDGLAVVATNLFSGV